MDYFIIAIMYIRTKKTPRSQSISVQLVESFRENGKIKQRVIRHFGTADTKEKIEELKQLAVAIKADLLNKKLIQKLPNNKTTSFGQLVGIGKEIPDDTLVHAAYLEEVQHTILGIHDIYGHVYEQVGFSNLFSRPAQRVYSASLLREIVLARIAEPKSKRGSVALLNEKFGITLNLDHVYQMMDKFDDLFYERIQQCALATALKLTGEKLRILFYDATTLYFESFTEDELKQNGYSKDMKFNQPQILLALFVTEKGLPVGYELFPGSTFEGHTLIPVLENLKARYQLEDVIFVADRGLFSEANLKSLEEKKFKYIVGARIKNVSKKLKESILDENNYRPIDIQWDDQKKIQKEKPIQRIATFDEKQKRQLIVHYHSERAKKDAYDRSKSIEKLYKKLTKSKDPKALLNNYGYKKYIDVRGDAKLGINKSKIEEAAQWDGLLGIITNITDSSPENLLMHYRGLWQIEESFRINKHDLKMRPIYHWKPHRIRAHIAISFMAFVCVRYLEYRLSLQSQKVSPEMIRQSLMQVQGSVINDTKSKKCFLLPSKINSVAKEIYRIFRITMPRKMLAIKRSA
jgi:transposase